MTKNSKQNNFKKSGGQSSWDETGQTTWDWTEVQKREELATKYHEVKNHYLNQKNHTRATSEKYTAVQKARTHYSDLLDDPFLTERRGKVLKQPSHVLNSSIDGYWGQVNADEDKKKRKKKSWRRFTNLLFIVSAVLCITDVSLNRIPWIYSHLIKIPSVESTIAKPPTTVKHKKSASVEILIDDFLTDKAFMLGAKKKELEESHKGRTYNMDEVMEEIRKSSELRAAIEEFQVSLTK